MSEIRCAYMLASLLISCFAGVLLVGAVAKTVIGVLEVLTHTQFQAKHFVAAHTAFDFLLKDCMIASEERADWAYADGSWAYRSGDQWVQWRTVKNSIYRAYGIFDRRSYVWIQVQNENILPSTSHVMIQPQFVRDHLQSIGIQLAYTHQKSTPLFFEVTMR